MAAKATKTKHHFSAMLREKLARAARMLGEPVTEIATLAKRTEETFRSLGRARKHTNGRTIVYADERIPLVFTNAKHVVKSLAMVKDPVDCAIAKCAKDPDACWVGAYATSVHVGNSTVTFWSELCPDLVLKCMLPMALRVAIKDWDKQVKKKVKHRRFKLADGTYFLSPYPPSMEHHNTKKKYRQIVEGKTKVVTRGKNFTKPTRRLTVRSDIAMAVSAAGLQKQAGKQARKKSA